MSILRSLEFKVKFEAIRLEDPRAILRLITHYETLRDIEYLQGSQYLAGALSRILSAASRSGDEIDRILVPFDPQKHDFLEGIGSNWRGYQIGDITFEKSPMLRCGMMVAIPQKGALSWLTSDILYAPFKEDRYG